MSEARVNRMLEVFEAALECPEGERPALVERECGSDQELRRGVLELLGESRREDGILDRGADLAAGDEAEDEAIGQAIGHYRILGTLGEGGMGVVYEAVQEEPVRRRVALKLLKLGMDTRSVVRRFEAERQALALMDHPGIASIQDGGVAPDGRPWFAMELFDGEPITSFCDERRLSVRERLALVLEVAHAVEHAHRRGIIHRDLKPSNVLVRDLDGRPAAKVIDFGIARLVDPAGAPGTLTAHGLRVGTPDYMSPEQAAGAADIDTRTDVYSLGLLLYELLVGALPLDRTESPAGARSAGEPDAPTPSARVRRLEGIGGVAARRRTDPGRLGRSLSGELDWIVMKAIAPERAQRYGSVAELADDLRHYLADRPVSAGPPRLAYRARKFARRHRAAVIGGTIALLAVVLGVAGVGWSAVAALRARADTEAALAQARQEAETTRAVSDLLFETLAAADPESGYGPPTEARDLKVIDVLDRAGEEAGVRFAARPLLEAEVRALVGRTLLRLNQFDDAEPHLQRARELRRLHLGEDAPETLAVRSDLATLEGERGRHEPQEALHRAVLSARRRVLGPDHPDTLASMTGLGDALVKQGRLDEDHVLGEFLLTLLDLKPARPELLAHELNINENLHLIF
jgi:serine/threonine protein kinase